MDKERQKLAKRLWWRRKKWGDPNFMERERERLRKLGRAIRARARELNVKRD
ncbi:MAG: hypothetical protein ACRCTG_14550 [Aestuariivirga sp.]